MGKDNQILSVDQLSVFYGQVGIVKNISLHLSKGEFLGIVGESGCGKSTMLGSLMMVKNNDVRISGNITFDGVKLNGLSDEQLRQLRGNQISMIPQNVFLSMDPTKTISSLFYETVRVHGKRISRKESDKRASEIMESLLLKDTNRILKSYPFELSGGMCQRVSIALAMINNPKLILCDELTSALDVSSQLQVVGQMKKLKELSQVSLIIISHNFGVVAQLCDRIAVMYGGIIVEYGKKEDILKSALHPYTKALITAIPDMEGNISKGLEGTPPVFSKEMKGCPFAERCSFVMGKCRENSPEYTQITESHYVKCYFVEDRQVR